MESFVEADLISFTLMNKFNNKDEIGLTLFIGSSPIRHFHHRYQHFETSSSIC